MKIFLDVGGHEGQILSSVLDPKYSFDRIFVFEPVKALHVKLNKIAMGKKNVVLLPFGLWNKTATQKIYSPGTLAGSLFMAHKDVDPHEFELCHFEDASEWFINNISIDDEVYMKLNCEGAEADILLNLLASNEIFKIKDVMIDFDTKKVKGLENMQQKVLDNFKTRNFIAYSLCEDAMKGPTPVTRIQHWLDSVKANRTDVKTRIKQLLYWLKMVISGQRAGYKWELKHIIKSYTPLFLLKLLNARRN